MSAPSDMGTTKMSFMMRAIVDKRPLDNGGASHIFDVHVEGGDPLVKVTYAIIADDENGAAQEGLKRFRKAYDTTPLPNIGDI
jgi:hypothetical protein